jgi:pyruvate/2-oxoglutarate dehydrogenase complex dihydrolipoamide dehydrogenase (E3) component
VESLGLESAGVAFNHEGVQVDDRLQTTQPGIYACGDVCSRFQFTHAADFMARTVIQNALFLGRARSSTLLIPRATYTSPEIAQVGINETEAAAQGIELSTFTQQFSGVDRAILDDRTNGFVRIHTRKGTDRIVGATIVAENAGDLISEISVAMRGKVGLGSLASVIHPYPTQADAIRKLGDAYNRTRLTPFVKSLMERWLAWRR